MARLASEQDLRQIRRIYDTAKAYMNTHGNPDQWKEGYPPEEMLRQDIRQGVLYVLENGAGLYGVFALIPGEDITYRVIEHGSWISDTPYVTIHRIASDGTHRGVLREAATFARTQLRHVRADTHRDNLTMQQALQKEGFRYCGIIHLLNGDERLAYEWVSGAEPSAEGGNQKAE